MNRQTQQIRGQLARAFGVRAKLNTLAQAYCGQTAYLVSCGPSLGDYDDTLLQERLGDELVIAVKQAYDKLPGIVDFHLLNEVHLKPYSYAPPRPIAVFAGSARNYDLVLPMVPARRDAGEEFFSRLLSRTLDFEPWTLDKRVERMSAGGIVPTVGFYLAVHLGISRLVTVGYDLTCGGGHHFYGATGDPGAPGVRNHMRWETETVSAAAPHWRAWLQSKGVTWVRAEASSPINLPGIATTRLG